MKITDENKKNRIWKVGDVFLVLTIVLVTIATILGFSKAPGKERGSTVVVEVKGKEVRRIPLEDEATRTFKVQGLLGESEYEISEGKVRMLSSACTDKICVRVGWIDSAGRMIVCLPNQIVIRVEGEKEGAVDTVSH